MGRYFQHAVWPAADFELEAAAQEVPESAVEFHASGGPCLIIIKLHLSNGTAGSANFRFDVMLDGVAIPRLVHAIRLAGGIFQTLSWGALVEIESGPHTLRVDATGVAVAADTITAGTGAITLLELNVQEAADRID